MRSSIREVDGNQASSAASGGTPLALCRSNEGELRPPRVGNADVQRGDRASVTFSAASTRWLDAYERKAHCWAENERRMKNSPNSPTN